jgi:hypothetical protein
MLNSTVNLFQDRTLSNPPNLETSQPSNLQTKPGLTNNKYYLTLTKINKYKQYLNLTQKELFGFFKQKFSVKAIITDTNLQTK